MPGSCASTPGQDEQPLCLDWVPFLVRPDGVGCWVEQAPCNRLCTSLLSVGARCRFGTSPGGTMRRLQIGMVVACAVVLAATTGVARGQDAATTVTCKDGTTGTAGRGACSHHGGVAKGAASAPAAAAPAPTASTATTVTCKDGSTGTAGRGACSHHGGVAKAMSSSAGSVAPAPAAPAAKPAPATPAPAAKPAPTTPAPAATTPAAKTPTSSAAGKSGTSETSDPTGAIAQCKDGLYSHSKTHTGTCSRHGGVAKWLDGTTP
jgi:hypothetical protein